MPDASSSASNRPLQQRRILDLFAEAWAEKPEQRMGQFLSNLRGLGPQDIFHWSDDELEQALNRWWEQASVRSFGR